MLYCRYRFYVGTANSFLNLEYQFFLYWRMNNWDQNKKVSTSCTKNIKQTSSYTCHSICILYSNYNFTIKINSLVLFISFKIAVDSMIIYVHPLCLYVYRVASLLPVCRKPLHFSNPVSPNLDCMPSLMITEKTIWGLKTLLIC